MKKVCPDCGRNRRIDKRYYKHHARRLKCQDVCKDCQKAREVEYHKTPKYRELKRKRDKKWYQKNRDQKKKYNSDYYKKNKERIMSRRNTESILIIENPSKKKINTSRYQRKNITDDIVINPQRKN